MHKNDAWGNHCWSSALTFAFESRSKWQISSWPVNAAECSGVQRLMTITSVAVSKQMIAIKGSSHWVPWWSWINIRFRLKQQPADFKMTSPSSAMKWSLFTRMDTRRIRDDVMANKCSFSVCCSVVYFFLARNARDCIPLKTRTVWAGACKKMRLMSLLEMGSNGPEH